MTRLYYDEREQLQTSQTKNAIIVKSVVIVYLKLRKA
jgi:hypothetical protein